ncbi:MAG: SDR family NAD(P)-dependent oxidoreductase [Magnetococcales bacterium]|nr:SDR family NAD(P)-dependent oxidoreductase [Magnetococcales bacterium]MBF0438947.1 SDR family NAD(P)-dependent oxidoreductase [Magnetococcales bacterium]
MKTILITGCSSGIGQCVAHGLRERGYRVFATARKLEDVAILQQNGFEAHLLDLDDSASIRRAVEWTVQLTGGTLDALFNNGAYGQPGAVEDISREALRAQFETNLFGTHELTRLVLPIMRRQGYGRVIQNSSVLGFVALPYRGAYVASKFALEGLTETLRLEWRGTGIYFSLIEPGPINTLFRKNATLAFQKHVEISTSVHQEAYRAMEAQFQQQAHQGGARFSLPPEAVLKKVIHALESRRPKVRYGVTFPTHVFAILRRLLPHRALDHLLAMV